MMTKAVVQSLSFSLTTNGEIEMERKKLDPKDFLKLFETKNQNTLTHMSRIIL